MVTKLLNWNILYVFVANKIMLIVKNISVDRRTS